VYIDLSAMDNKKANNIDIPIAAVLQQRRFSEIICGIDVLTALDQQFNNFESVRLKTIHIMYRTSTVIVLCQRVCPMIKQHLNCLWRFMYDGCHQGSCMISVTVVRTCSGLQYCLDQCNIYDI